MRVRGEGFFSWLGLGLSAVLLVACGANQGADSPGAGDRVNTLNSANFPVAASPGGPENNGGFINPGSNADIRGRAGYSFLFSPDLGKDAAEIGADPAATPSTPTRADEFWIVAADRDARARGDCPGTGSMVGRGHAGTELPLPLQSTDVHARVRGCLSTVDVDQRFSNPYDEKIEAIYVFPLPADAAVRDFVLKIGDRQIRGIIRDRDEARQIYQEARAQGYRAALLEQARPNVFEQAIANLEPGRPIDVHLRYFHTLAVEGDTYAFVFPMVVGPRYNPPGSRHGIGALPADGGGRAQPTNVTYLPPGTRGGNDVAVTVDVDAGLPLADVDSPSHDIEVERPSATRASVRLAAGATIPNRDFVLRYRLGGADHRASLFAQCGDGGGHLLLLLQPPAQLAAQPRQPMELVFLIDCSGSMDGDPLAQVKAVVDLALQKLRPSDTVQVVAFANDAQSFARAPVAASEDNLARVQRFVHGLRASGGTEMLTGFRTALGAPRDRDGRPRHIVLLSDGFIGNETEILAAIRDDRGGARVTGFGIGSSVNRYLFEGVAAVGRGAVAFLQHDERPERAVSQLLAAIVRPALSDLEIDWGGAAVDEVYPRQLPDLYAGRPVLLAARFAGRAPTRVRVHGRLGEQRVAFDAALAAEDNVGCAELPAVWARRKIQSLVDHSGRERGEVDARGVRQLALRYGLVSDFTSFVAVDASRQTPGDHGTTVQVPVPVPAGTRYDTTVSGR